MTYELFRQGISVEEISEQRNLKPTTIYSHLAKLYLDGKDVDIHQFVTKEIIKKVQKAQSELASPPALKPYFEFLKEEIPYSQIRIALTILEKIE